MSGQEGIRESQLETVATPDVPNVALAEFVAPEDFEDEDCPLCEARTPITSF